MYSLLVETMGFPEESLVMLVDDGEAATDDNYPSKANIEVSSEGLVRTGRLINNVTGGWTWMLILADLNAG